jgi:hypothetical protein
MLTELGYQVKTHTVSKQPRKTKYPANFPIFYFFIFYFLFFLLLKKMQYGKKT